MGIGCKSDGSLLASIGPFFLYMNHAAALTLLKINAKGFIIVKFQAILLLFNPIAFFLSAFNSLCRN